MGLITAVSVRCFAHQRIILDAVLHFIPGSKNPGNSPKDNTTSKKDEKFPKTGWILKLVTYYLTQIISVFVDDNVS